MSLDAGQVLKRAVFCPHCNEDTLFSLRAIADDAELRCPYCRNTIDIRDHSYELLVRDVRHTSTDASKNFGCHPKIVRANIPSSRLLLYADN